MAAQVRQALRRVPTVARLSNGQKQEVADTLMLNAFFNEQWVADAKKRPATMPTVKTAIRQAAQGSLGLDVTRLKLGPNGFY